MKKAPKAKKKIPGYVDGGNTLAYQVGNPNLTDVDKIYTPEKKGKGTFGEQAADFGRGAAQVGLGLLGADDLVKDTYKTGGGQKFGDINDKYIAPVAGAVGKAGLNALGSTFGDPMLGNQVQALGSTANNIVESKRTARLPGETDSAYSKRLADMGVDINSVASDRATENMTQGLVNTLAPGVESLFASGGTVSANKAKEILKDGTVHGRSLTSKQKRYFGWLAGGGQENLADGGAVKKKPDFSSNGMSGTTTIGNQLTTANPMNLVTYFPALGKDGAVEYYRGSIKMTPNQLKQDSLSNKDSNAFPLSPTQGYRLSQEEAEKAYKENPKLFWHGSFPGGLKTDYGNPFNYQTKKEGGEIEGKGGPKDDAIKAEIKPGSFVVPAENAHMAEEIRKKFFGDKKKAKLHQDGGADVRLSNGEHLFTKEEKDYLMNEHGIDLEELAPNAKPGNMHSNGTTGTGVEDDYTTSDNVDEKTSKKKESETLPDSAKENEMKVNWGKYINPENALSLAQVLYGRDVLKKSGKRPVDILDPSFNQAVEQARNEAAYGYDAATKAGLKSDIESNRRAMTEAAVNLGGGNVAQSLANTRAAGNVSGRNLIDLAAADAQLKMDKERSAAAMIKDRAAMNRRLFEDKMRAFDINQAAGSNLLNAGIENFFGSRMLDKQISAQNDNSSAFNADNLVKWMDTYNAKKG